MALLLNPLLEGALHSTRRQHGNRFPAKHRLPAIPATPLGQAQDSCDNLPVVPEQEWALVIPMAPKQTRSGVGRIVSRTRPTPEPIIELDVE